MYIFSESSSDNKNNPVKSILQSSKNYNMSGIPAKKPLGIEKKRFFFNFSHSFLKLVYSAQNLR